MNGKISGNRAPRRAGALVAVAAVAVLATACGTPSLGSSASGASITYAQEVALAQCMRGHGVPSFPDPNASGGFSAGSVDLDSSQTQAAYGDCRHLLAGGGPNISQLQQEEQQEQQALAKALPMLVKYSACMRSHGLPTFPDPTASGGLELNGTGINPGSPQFQTAASACQHALPAGAQFSTHRSTGTRRS